MWLRVFIRSLVLYDLDIKEQFMLHLSNFLAQLVYIKKTCP